MKAQTNRHLFTQTGVDSGALTMLGAVIHSFREAGEYQIVLMWNNETIRRFPLIVDDQSEAMQVDVDLAWLHRPVLEQVHEGRYMLKPGGHAVFHASRGAGGYAVIVVRLGEPQPGEGGHGRRPAAQPHEAQPLPFDSRELRDGDMFAVTLLRPGMYTLTNAVNRAQGEIGVAYPKARTQHDPALEPISIECANKGFNPNRIQLQPGQGQVYRISTPSRLRIELVKPDDGPEGERPPRLVGWRKPVVFKAKPGK